jgi:subtilisin family serine protease
MKNLTIGILMGLGMLASSVEAAEKRFHPHHLFVKMKNGESLVQSPLIKNAKKLIGSIYLVKSSNPAALAEELKSLESVEYTQMDYFSEKRMMPKLEVLEPVSSLKKMSLANFNNFNDPDAAKLWAFNSTAGMDVNGAYTALGTRTQSLKPVIVAVVDTGVDHTHEDLRDIMWKNEKEIAGNKIDDDNNGYIDDIHGINTLVRDAQGRATMNTMASHWHGTHVAGTIAAEQNNGIGIAGVASNVKIMAIRTVPDDADELDTDIVEGFLYAAKMGAKIINCSFGKSNNEGGMIVRDVINEIGKKYNVLVIASAGNDSNNPFGGCSGWCNNDTRLKYPASFDSENLLVVASTMSSGAMSSFSNTGIKTVDVAAPGSNIYSTINGGKYGMASGTSMASPNTSGVAAMILGAYPTLTAVQLKNVLMNTVTKVPAFEKLIVTGGRVNLKAGLQKASTLRK